MKIKNVIFIMIITIVIMCMTGCSNEFESSLNLNNKIETEIQYLDDQIFCLIMRYSKGEYFIESDEVENTMLVDKENKIDWKLIEKDLKNINSSMDTIMLDFSESYYQKKITSNEIKILNTKANDINIAVSKKDEIGFLKTSSEFLEILSNYYKLIFEDSNNVKREILKSEVLKCYVQAIDKEWELSQENILLAKEEYEKMILDEKYKNEYYYNIDRIEILLEEVKNAIDLHEIELLKIKYINFVEKFGN